MNQNNLPSFHTSCSGRIPRRVGKALLTLSLLTCVIACVSCNDQSVPIVDTEPLGQGLKVIAYAVLGVGVLGVLSKLVK